jgi:hypothetical protein
MQFRGLVFSKAKRKRCSTSWGEEISVRNNEAAGSPQRKPKRDVSIVLSSSKRVPEPEFNDAGQVDLADWDNTEQG